MFLLKASCRANDLDNSDNNWESGHTDSFSGSQIGACNGFLISDVDFDTRDYDIVLHHHDIGAVFIEWIELGFDKGRNVRCTVGKDLDNDDDGLAHSCYNK